MGIRVRRYKRGGWEVDGRFRLPNGVIERFKLKSPCTSKTASERWGEELIRTKIATTLAPPVVIKEVPTFEEFAPRFVEGHCVANRHKPSGIEDKRSKLRVHLLPAFGTMRLDEITSEDVQRLKVRLLSRSPKTVNNIMTTLRSLLKTAVAWGVIDRMPCAVPEVKAPKPTMGFLDFDEFERLVMAASAIDPITLLIVLLAGEAGLRAGEIMGLRRCDVDLVRGRLLVSQSIWRGHVTVPKGGKSRYVPMTKRLVEAVRQHRHLRSEFLLCDRDGTPLSYKQVWGRVRAAGQKAQVIGAAHRLRHTFCSHLAMRGAPMLAIKELAGHRSLMTTQGYMHLSPAAAESAIRLLDERMITADCGGIVETALAEK
jgi:integrase